MNHFEANKITIFVVINIQFVVTTERRLWQEISIKRSFYLFICSNASNNLIFLFKSSQKEQMHDSNGLIWCRFPSARPDALRSYNWECQCLIKNFRLEIFYRGFRGHWYALSLLKFQQKFIWLSLEQTPIASILSKRYINIWI